MAILNAIIWGAIQGLTEFIPVSSSGHLVIIPRFFGIEAPDLIFIIALHLGTLLAVIIFFWKDIIALFTTKKSLGILVLLGTLPVLIYGLLFADKIKGMFENPQAAGLMLIVNGGILLIAHLKLRNVGVEASPRYSPGRAIIIGIAQAFALFPGISRSGITITTGIYTGLDRKEAYKFSFLLFIPASILSFLYSIKEGFSIKGAFSINMLVGAIVSAIFGILALKVLYELIKRARLYPLGIYCILIGLLALYLF